MTGIIAGGETLEVEFKSDQRQISDQEIYEDTVAMANTNGGLLLLGVEDSGEVTGLNGRRQARDPLSLQAAIFNNTVPNVNTDVRSIRHPAGEVVSVEVLRYPQTCATAQGRVLRRVIGGDGKPATVPFYPHEQTSRRTDLGFLDYSDQPVEGASFEDLNPLEFTRLRSTIRRLHGDQALLELGDPELAQALQLVETQGSRLVPKVAAVLLLGRNELILSVLPTHEINFQVIDTQGEVRVNEALRSPLLQVLEGIEERFGARNQEQEVQVGMFRLPVPDYSLDGFREAVNNAVLHRDYTRLGSVYIQWHPDHLFIASPGGFPEGITLENLLVHEPKPRNPRLAAACRRINLIEQTGRGVDRIFLGQLRYGRPAPDYSRSDVSGVRVLLRGGQPSLEFAALVYEQDRTGSPLGLDELLILNALFHERRIDAQAAGSLIQKGATQGRVILERLHERGLVEGRGEKRGRVYILAASLYRRLGRVDGYVRTRGFDRIQQREMILNALRAQGGKIRRGDVAGLCQISDSQAYHLLHKMVEDGDLQMYGSRRGAYYTLTEPGK